MILKPEGTYTKYGIRMSRDHMASSEVKLLRKGTMSMHLEEK